MGLDIHEMRDEDAAAAAALWRSSGLSPSLGDCRALSGSLIVVGYAGDKLEALAGCTCERDGGYVMRVAVAGDEHAESYRQQITGVTMRKLRSRGISKCAVEVAGDAGGRPFFKSLRFNIPAEPSSDAA